MKPYLKTVLAAFLGVCALSAISCESSTSGGSAYAGSWSSFTLGTCQPLGSFVVGANGDFSVGGGKLCTPAFDAVMSVTGNVSDAGVVSGAATCTGVYCGATT